MMLFSLLQKEFIQILRNTFVPKLVVVYPILIICVAPWIMNMEVKNITIDVVDSDHSTTSQRFLHRIEASKYFIFHGQPATYTDALAHLNDGQVDVIMEIPPHYEHDLVASQSSEGKLKMPSVQIVANAANAQKGGIGTGYLSQIIMQMVQEEAKTGIKVGEMSSPEISVMNLYNRQLNYKVFMIPVLIGLLVMLLCGFLPALNIVGEKESGTIEQINVTPVSKTAFIFSKLLPYWIIGMLVISLCLLLSWAVYGIVSVGSLWLVYLLAMLLALVFSGLGLIVSNYSNTMQQAMLLMWFFVVLMMLLSGMFTPIRSMPIWAQHIVQLNPMQYFVSAIRTVFIRGGNWESIQQQLIILAGFVMLLDGWAVWSYRKNQ